MPIGVIDETRGIRVIKPKGFYHARHQFHRGRVYVPAQRRAIACAHAKTDDQRGFGPALVKSHRQMDHEFGDRCQYGHSNAIDEKVFVTRLAKGNDRGGVIPPDDRVFFGAKQHGLEIPDQEQ